jgi:HAD superfamily hydrolase (TIGR01509 family)
MIKGLIFDFDGLILDTESVLIDAWMEMHQLAGLPCDRATALHLVGEVDHKVDWWAAFGAHVDRKVINEKYRALRRDRLLKQPLLPGVRERLEEARALNLRIGIASNSSHDWIDGHLPRYQLSHYFSVIRCREDVPRGKPEPDVYSAVVDALGVAPSETVAFEDSRVGVAAAKAAGLRCVAVPNPCTRNHDFRQADLVLPSLLHVQIAGLADSWNRS